MYSYENIPSNLKGCVPDFNGILLWLCGFVDISVNISTCTHTFQFFFGLYSSFMLPYFYKKTKGSKHTPWLKVEKHTVNRLDDIRCVLAGTPGGMWTLFRIIRSIMQRGQWGNVSPLPFWEVWTFPIAHVQTGSCTYMEKLKALWVVPADIPTLWLLVKCVMCVFLFWGMDCSRGDGNFPMTGKRDGSNDWI